MIETQIILYTSYLHEIGGIETFVYNFIDIMSEYYDIALMSPNLPQQTIAKLSRKIRVVKPMPMKCDSLIMLRIMDEVPKDVTYGKLIRTCHACKTRPEWHITQDFDTLVNVSKASKESFGKEAKDGIVIHNMLKPSQKKSLILVSATRIPAKDKGSNEQRMLTLARMLETNHIPFLWFNFSDGKLQNAPKGFVNVGTTEDVQPFIARADYLVQLSDAEGFCYSLVEALINNTPVICTPFKTTEELGVISGVNGYVDPFDMNFDVNRLLDVPQFEYEYDNKPMISKWRKILGKKAKRGDYKPPQLVLLKIIRTYRDVMIGRVIHEGEEIAVPIDRARIITEEGYGVEVKE